MVFSEEEGGGRGGNCNFSVYLCIELKFTLCILSLPPFLSLRLTMDIEQCLRVLRESSCTGLHISSLDMTT